MGRYAAKNTETANAENTEKVTETQKGTDMTAADIFDDEFVADEAVETDPADDTVEADTNEADTNEAAPEAEAKVEAEPDITNFVALVQGVVSRDDSGEVAEIEAEDVLKIQNAYKALSRKEKNLAKNDLTAKMEQAVMVDDDISLAKFYLEISNKMLEAPKVAKKTGEPKKPVDPSEALVKLIAKLDLARALVQIPEGMDAADITKRAGELFAIGAADAQKDEHELVWVKQAINLATSKKVKDANDGTVRTRHSVSNHIAEAFANAKPGEKMTVSQLADFKSSEYGDDRPSKQAIIAHLASKKFLAATTLSVADEGGEPVLVKK